MTILLWFAIPILLVIFLLGVLTGVSFSKTGTSKLFLSLLVYYRKKNIVLRNEIVMLGMYINELEKKLKN